ncbi:MAG: GTPase [Acidobacteriota bacterium]|nr:50S ribosome-binding GTPase [Acidobacteriota bacterium]
MSVFSQAPVRDQTHPAEPVVLLIGQANVGKSDLSNVLTRTSTIVSNYPGTTVELARGAVAAGIQVRRLGT